MEAESYADPQISSFIQQNFVPIGVHIKQNPAGFARFESVWTPTALILDENGKERFRIEGYLPKDDFAAHLLTGLARIAFMNKKWADAERLYNEIVQKYPDSTSAPEAIYWAGVSKYRKTNDHQVLGEVPKTLQQKYPDSVWAKKASPWAA